MWSQNLDKQHNWRCLFCNTYWCSFTGKSKSVFSTAQSAGRNKTRERWRLLLWIIHFWFFVAWSYQYDFLIVLWNRAGITFERLLLFLPLPWGKYWEGHQWSHSGCCYSWSSNGQEPFGFYCTVLNPTSSCFLFWISLFPLEESSVMEGCWY